MGDDVSRTGAEDDEASGGGEATRRAGAEDDEASGGGEATRAGASCICSQRYCSSSGRGVAGSEMLARVIILRLRMGILGGLPRSKGPAAPQM